VILLSRGSFDEKDPAIFSSWCRSTIRSMRTACQLVHDLSKRKASGQAFRRVGTMASRLIEGVAPDRADALTSGVVAWVSSGTSGAQDLRMHPRHKLVLRNPDDSPQNGLSSIGPDDVKLRRSNLPRQVSHGKTQQ
jgi:hypothetical protein